MRSGDDVESALATVGVLRTCVVLGRRLRLARVFGVRLLWRVPVDGVGSAVGGGFVAVDVVGCVDSSGIGGIGGISIVIVVVGEVRRRLARRRGTFTASSFVSATDVEFRCNCCIEISELG